MSKNKKHKMSNRVPITVSQVAEAAKSFLDEAERCSHSEPVMGFAAMTTALACLIAMGEALTGQAKSSDATCISAFCRKMTSFDWFLPNPRQDQQYAADILSRVRNSLAHALSLPVGVVLL